MQTCRPLRLSFFFFTAVGGVKLFCASPHCPHRRVLFNPLTPNDPYRGRTAPLTSKRCILYIYPTNIGTEYFKHGIYSHFSLFKMQFVSNSNLFGSYIIHILYTECAKIKQKIPCNDPYSGRTAPLTSKRCILYIYPTNIGTEYFKHGIYSHFSLFKMQFVS